MLILLASGCSLSRQQREFSQLTEEFVYTTLAFSPVGATQAGYHVHQGKNLDELLDDLSPASIEEQRKFYRGFRNRMGSKDGLSQEDQADFDIISDQISLQLLELDRIQNYRHNPTLYVELIGNALFNPLVLEYAPKAQRIRHIIARLDKVPAFLDQARRNLVDSPEVWNKVAVSENDGNIGLIDKAIRKEAPPELLPGYDRAAKSALEALRRFQDYLNGELSKKRSDWRLGREKYNEKFRYTLATDRSSEQVLAVAEADLNTVRQRMLEFALPLDRTLHPGHAEQSDPNVLISEVLRHIAERHAKRETYMEDAKRDLEEARQFVREKHLVTLPSRENLQVIPTPEFMRGIYSVGGFAQAPALEPQLGAFYWVTPIPKDWPAERMESKLREYNFYKLKLLTIHEAMPGHYVQMEYANDIQPKTRRILRSIFGNGPYIEGWAQYSEQLMLDSGFLNSSPELRLTFEKEELRVIANAVLDIRLHTMGMTDQQALDLMEKQAFQETEEATEKLQRAKLSSCQLPTYLVGWRDWMRVRERYKQAQGARYRLTEFNDRALKQGAVPLPVLARLLGAPLSGPAQGGTTSRGSSNRP